MGEVLKMVLITLGLVGAMALVIIVYRFYTTAMLIPNETRRERSRRP